MEFSTASKVVPCGSNATVSMEPEVLASIAQVVSDATAEVSSISNTIQSLSNSTADGVWRGPDADTFRTKAEELITLFNNLNSEIAADGEWAGKAGNIASETVEDNVGMMSRI